MASTAKRLDVEHSMNVEAQLALLGERTETLQRDVTEIKTTVRHIDSKLNTTAEKLAGLEPKLDGLAARFDAKLASLDSKLDGMATSFDAKLTALGATLDSKLKAMETGLIKWLIVTVLGVLTAVGGGGYVVARFFS
jgi:chromosome segregation ATPase